MGLLYKYGFIIKQINQNQIETRHPTGDNLQTLNLLRR